jgi:acyl carrier protein
MMTKEELIEKINDIFEDFFEIEKKLLTPEAHLFEELGLDSLDIVDLVVIFQEAFGVNLREDERLKDIRTLGDVYDFLDGIKDQFKS